MSSTTATLQPSRPHVTPRALSAQTQRQSSRSSIPGRDCARSASHPYPRRSRDIRKDSVARHVDAAAEIPSIAGEHTWADEQGGMAQRPTKPMMKFDDFELMQTLGTGTFARVWLCRFKARKADEDNRVYALKVLRKVDVVKLKQVEHVRNERTVLAAVAGHPFIAQLLTTFSDPHSLYMLMEYTPGGELFSYLRRARRFPPSTVQFYAAEITLILGYLHDVQHVAYRDLKPENILLDADGHLKLVDFGFAKYLPPSTAPPIQPTGGLLQSHTQPQAPPLLAAYSQAQPQAQADTTAIPPPTPSVTYTLCGTPEYLAPEVIRNTGHTTAVDWWALGILVYEMLIGQPPFWDQNPMRIYEQIVQGHIRFPVSHGGGSSSLSYSSNHNTSSHHRSSLHIPRAAREFILALCKTDPSMRLGHILGGSKRVMAHHFFDGVNWDDLYYKRKRGPIVPRVEWAGDAGNFDEYPDPTTAEGESEGGRGHYTPQMREQWDSFFEDF